MFTFLFWLVFCPGWAHAQFGPEKDPGSFSSWLSNSGEFVFHFIYILLGLIGVISLLSLGIAVVLFVTAGGGESRLSLAGQFFVYSILGILVSLVGYFSVHFAQGHLVVSLLVW